MAGLFFEYFDGCLQVEFSNGRRSGFIEISFCVSGDAIVTTPCDDNFEKGEPEGAVAEDCVLRCWASSCVGRFFRDMRCWLEAVTCGVAECSFYWDGEGPDGELRWFGRHESGRLRMDWTGTNDSNSFEREVRLNKVQMVRAFYDSFRKFVDSDRYDPINYEELLYGDVFDLMLTDGREALVRELARRDRLEAHMLVETIMGVAHKYDARFPTRAASLSEFMRKAGSYWECRSSDDGWAKEQKNCVLDEAWDDWTAEQRHHFVEEKLCSFGSCGEHGENLRELRSPLVESWLATQSRETADDRAVIS